MAWDLAVPDWQDRIRAGRSLLPALPDLDRAEAARAVGIFNKLRLPDVVGQPPLSEAGGDWFREIVGAILGSVERKTGKRMLRELFLLAPKKSSKALALDTLIATPSGFTTMGKISVGDVIFDADGHQTRVSAKSVVFIGRPCLEVAFSTGETVVCDTEHLWVTDSHRDRERLNPREERARPRPSVKTTAEISETLTVPSGRYSINNHRTAICGSLELPNAVLPIAPYALGAWLGDGTTAAAALTAGIDEADALVERLVANGEPAYVRARFAAKGSATISMGDPESGRARNPSRFRTAARLLGLIGNKHIPPLYLRASQEQRLALLCGLMDTDGHVTIRGECILSTTLPRLRDDARELIASLGFKPTVSEHRSVLAGKDCGPCWNVRFTAYRDRPIALMARKAERQKERPSRSARSESRQIVSVRRVPSVPVQCIAVESDTRQFLITRSFIPTHNTSYGAAFMVTALLMNERPRAEFLLIAPTISTASLAFNQAVGMVLADPFLVKRMHIRENIKSITDRKTKASLVIKSFETNVLTGVKPSGVLLDELHEIAKNPAAERIIGQLRGGILPNPEAFIAFITTQSDQPPRGAFLSELLTARKVRDGKSKAAMLSVLYEFPPDIALDKAIPPAWENPETWWMVTPNLGRPFTVDDLAEDFEKAKDKGTGEIIRWASQHLNIEIGLALGSDRWAGAEHWERRAEKTLGLAEIIRRCVAIVVGVDGGGLDDLLGMAVLGRDATGKRLLWNRAWAHTSVLERRKSEASRMRDFERGGDLSVVEKMDDAFVQMAALIEQVKKSGKLCGVAVDPAGVKHILAALDTIGIAEATGIPQGWKLSGAIKDVEIGLSDGTLTHAGQPMMAWCVSNAKAEAKGNAITITKQASGSAKIDPLVATFIAESLMGMNPQPDVVLDIAAMIA